MKRTRLWFLIGIALALAAGGCTEGGVNPFDPAQDTDPPIVTRFTVEGGVAVWETDEDALCVLEYGVPGGYYDHYVYESTKEHSKLHQVTLLGTEDGEQYRVRVRCEDRAGNEGYLSSTPLPVSVAGTAYDGETMSLAMIDVGFGLSMLLSTPGGANVLIDAGNGDLGDNPHLDQVLSFLWDHGVSYLDAAVATHDHVDHYGGYVEDGGVLDMFSVGVFIAPDPAQAFQSMDGSLVDAIEDHGVSVGYVSCGDTPASNPSLAWDGTPGFEVEVLAAGLGGKLAEGFADPDEEEGMLTNNDSVVLKLGFGGVSFITTGDAEFYAEYDIIGRYGRHAVGADLLQVGHHGSDDASSELWLDNVDPRVALISNAMAEAPLEKEVVLQNIMAVDADYFVTDRVFPNTPRDADPIYGNVIAITDGRTIEVVLEIHDW